jgi:hypothetical protein
MSLESEIKELTQAIKGLTAELKNGKIIDQPITNTFIEDELPRKPEQEQKLAPVETQKPEKTGMSREELQSGCLNLVREDAKNKAKIRAILNSMGATIISDLKDNQLAEFEAKLGEL